MSRQQHVEGWVSRRQKAGNPNAPGEPKQAKAATRKRVASKTKTAARKTAIRKTATGKKKARVKATGKARTRKADKPARKPGR